MLGKGKSGEDVATISSSLPSVEESSWRAFQVYITRHSDTGVTVIRRLPL